MRQDNTIYKFSIKISYSSKGQNKSKLQKQGLKRMLFNETIQYNIQMFDKTIFLK